MQKRKGKVHYGKMLIKQIKAEMWVPGTNSKREREEEREGKREGEREGEGVLVGQTL